MAEDSAMEERNLPGASAELAPVLLVGVGHAGGSVLLSVMEHCGGEGLSCLAVDTDAADLARFSGSKVDTLLAGEESTGGHGVHGDTELAEMCMQEEKSLAAFHAALQKHRLLVVVSGIGGCTGGALEPLLNAAEEESVPVILFAMLPFAFEDGNRRNRAQQVLGLQEFRCQALLAAPNEVQLQDVMQLPAADAFRELHHRMAVAVSSLAVPFSRQNLLNVNPGLFSILAEDGTCRCVWAIAEGHGEGAVEATMEMLQKHPVLRSETVKRGCRAVLLVRIGRGISLEYLDAVMNGVRHLFGRQMYLETAACLDEGMACDICAVLLVHSPVGETELPSVAASGERGGAASGSREKDFLDGGEELGIFAGDPRNRLEDGTNLDVPTFWRKGVKVDRGM